MRAMHRGLVLGAALVLATASTVAAGSAPKSTSYNPNLTYSGPTVDKSVALVQLKGAPISTYSKTKASQGKKINLNSATVKSYKATLAALRNEFKQWLQVNAPKARITGSWDLALNAVSVQLNGTTLTKVRTAPQVVRAEYEGLYHPDTAIPDIDLSLIHAIDAWNEAQIGGNANAGKGVKIAMIDSGIDITNPCFSPTGFSYPAGFPKGDTNFTNAKVIVAKVFANKTPGKYTPEALQEHGTHTSGTAACDYGTTATVNGVTIPYPISGVAPAAQLGNYNIFPGAITNARSEDILNALTAAYADGMDVANMSIGGGANGIQDLVTIAVDNLDEANMVVAVAAGNSAAGDSEVPHRQAPGYFTVESPGSAARALTAGAISVGHQVISFVLQGANTYGTQDGDFAYPTSDLTAAAVEAPSGAAVSLVGDHLDGCDPYASPVTGDIVIVARGTCSFAQKVNNAQVAGAVGVIVVNRDPAPIPMADDPTLGNTIPAVMVGHDDGIALYDALPTSVTITAPHYVSQLDPSTAAYAPLSNLQADFSSLGPTDVDYRIKPDVMAPGVNVVSSIPAAFCDAPPCFAFFDGTSMATPHLAGAAAVLKAEHPSWSAWEIRSAIVNTADQNVIWNSDGTALQHDVLQIGSGRENLDSAVKAWVTLDPVSVSFGTVPSGSGQTLGYTVHIKNESGSSHTFDLSVGAGGGGVHFSVGVPSITLAGGATGSFTVWMTADKGAVLGPHQATLSVSGTTVEYAHMAVFTWVK